MLDFMILGLPRTATTWAANWLTTDTTLCLHDPLNNWHYTDLDKLESRRRVGVACTGLYNFGAWLNDHPAPKVILHRDLGEINAELRRLGLPDVTEEDKRKLGRIAGYHCHFADLFNNPAPIYERLLGLPFDQERQAELCQIVMQPRFEGLTYNPAVIRRLVSEINQGA